MTMHENNWEIRSLALEGYPFPARPDTTIEDAKSDIRSYIEDVHVGNPTSAVYNLIAFTDRCSPSVSEWAALEFLRAYNHRTDHGAPSTLEALLSTGRWPWVAIAAYTHGSAGEPGVLVNYCPSHPIRTTGHGLFSYSEGLTLSIEYHPLSWCSDLQHGAIMSNGLIDPRVVNSVASTLIGTRYPRDWLKGSNNDALHFALAACIAHSAFPGFLVNRVFRGDLDFSTAAEYLIGASLRVVQYTNAMMDQLGVPGVDDDAALQTAGRILLRGLSDYVSNSPVWGPTAEGVSMLTALAVAISKAFEISKFEELATITNQLMAIEAELTKANLAENPPAPAPSAVVVPLRPTGPKE